MFNISNLDLVPTSVDGELTQTPRKNDNPYKTVFPPGALSEDIRFTPSAWKTPVRPQTGETPFELGTPHASLFGTPGAYHAAVSPFRTPRGMPSLHQSPVGNIGVTPARVMGPFPRRDLSFEITPLPSPISMLGHRRIYTPRILREKQARGSLEEGDGPDLLDASLFGTAEAPDHSPNPPFSRSSAPFAGPGRLEPAPTLLALSIPPTPTTSPPLEAALIRNVKVVDGMDSDGEDEVDTEEDAEEGEDEDEDEDEGVTYHTQSLTESIHSQHGAQNESTDDAGNVWRPFPHDRDTLVTYLEEGLSLRCLFPSSMQGGRVRCEAELELVGGLWRHAGMCHKSEGSLESYQRHIKSNHLGVKRSTQVSVDYIVNTVWGCQKTIPKQPKTWLRVQPWVPNLPDFQLAA